MSVVQNMLNIPYKDCFTVNTVWLIQPQGSGCSVKIFVKVRRSRGGQQGGQQVRASAAAASNCFVNVRGSRGCWNIAYVT